MIILGIDPGTTRAGFGVIKKEKGIFSLLESGILETNSKDPSEILSKLSSHLEKIIKKHKPELAAIEKLYFSKNKKTALSVAEARGVILLSLKNNSIPIIEFSPTEIKSCLTGSGRAEKKDVIRSVELILKQKIEGVDDISDALAAAILASSRLQTI